MVRVLDRRLVASRQVRSHYKVTYWHLYLYSLLPTNNNVITRYMPCNTPSWFMHEHSRTVILRAVLTAFHLAEPITDRLQPTNVLVDLVASCNSVVERGTPHSLYTTNSAIGAFVGQGEPAQHKTHPLAQQCEVPALKAVGAVCETSIEESRADRHIRERIGALL